MNKQLGTINNEYLTCVTGDPFADVGGYAIKEFAERYPDKNILELIEEVTKIYVSRWSAKINPFFLNSKITQPAFDAKKKVDETMKYFRSLFEEQDADVIDYCRITGQKTKLFLAGRDNSILSGSGTFINFHHGLEGGIMVSKEALIRFHFVPLACLYLQGRIALISSNDSVLSEFFARENCSQNLHSIAIGISDGILKSECRSPGTALFRFIDGAISKSKVKYGLRNYVLTLYHFTNFGASPEVKIYMIPAMLFAFYTSMQKGNMRDDWNRFVANYYMNSDYKGAKYNQTTNTVDFERKGEGRVIEEVEFQNWTNLIYTRLLINQSILPYILKWSRKNRFNFKILEIYQINIRNMKKETLAKIDEMAEFILRSNDKDIIKKSIKKLDVVKSAFLLRRFVLKDVVAKYYAEGNEKAILTVEEYANYLFPDTGSWQETRDVLLIAIYQKMHERNLVVPAELEEDELELNEVE